MPNRFSPGCGCCGDPPICDVSASVSYASGNMTASGNGTGPFTFVARKNGSIVYSVSGASGSVSTVISVAVGDTVSASIVHDTIADCEDSATCTRNDIGTLSPASCQVVDPSIENACIDGDTVTFADFYTTPPSRTVTISGLVGPMAALNGVYSVSCASPSASGLVSWSDSAFAYNNGCVSVLWQANGALLVRIRSYHHETSSNFGGYGSCVHPVTNPGVPPATYASAQVQLQVTAFTRSVAYETKQATCADCQSAGSTNVIDSFSDANSSFGSCLNSSGVASDSCALDGSISYV